MAICPISSMEFVIKSGVFIPLNSEMLPKIELITRERVHEGY